MAIIAALLFRWRTGQGQHLSCAIHEAVAKCTEVDLMSWVMRRVLVLRQTCRHARETVSPFPSIAHTKDGRWVMANLGTRPGDVARLIALLERYGMAAGLSAEQTRRAPRGTVRSRHRAGDGGARAPTPWRPCSASCGPSPTRTCPGVKPRRRACSGRRCASRTRTPSIRTGWPARAVRMSNTPNWVAPSATPRANGSARPPPGRSAGGRRCCTRMPRPWPRRRRAPCR